MATLLWGGTGRSPRWPACRQDAFYENYFESQRDHIFRNVELLIYVFDIESREMEVRSGRGNARGVGCGPAVSGCASWQPRPSRAPDTLSPPPRLQRDLAYYESCVEAIQENSPQAKVFVLLHKMDLVAEEKRDAVFLERSKLIESHSRGHEITPYRTSIWDETLYKAWSSIVHSLVPNIRILERSLEDFCDVCGADEAVLFERATFLVICHAARRSHADSHRFEKISNIVKQFKLSCRCVRGEGGTLTAPLRRRPDTFPPLHLAARLRRNSRRWR